MAKEAIKERVIDVQITWVSNYRYANQIGTREKRSAHACLPCFWRIFAIEIIRDNKTN